MLQLSQQSEHEREPVESLFESHWVEFDPEPVLKRATWGLPWQRKPQLEYEWTHSDVWWRRWSRLSKLSTAAKAKSNADIAAKFEFLRAAVK